MFVVNTYVNTNHLFCYQLILILYVLDDRWLFVGNTIVTNNYVRLTSEQQSQRGAIWNTLVWCRCLLLACFISFFCSWIICWINCWTHTRPCHCTRRFACLWLTGWWLHFWPRVGQLQGWRCQEAPGYCPSCSAPGLESAVSWRICRRFAVVSFMPWSGLS